MKHKVAGYVSVIGPSYCRSRDDIYVFARELGSSLVNAGYVVCSGGRLGIMEAVFRGAREAENYFFGATVGILPDSSRLSANRYTDISIPTGMGYARNSIVAHAGDVVVAIGGGSGTMSELAFAWQYGKPIICVDRFDGWAADLAGRKMDRRKRPPTFKASDVSQVMKILKELMP